MSIRNDLQEQITSAMKSGDAERRDVLRYLWAEIKKAEIDLGHDMSDEEITLLLQKEIKRRKEALVQFESASRDDLVARERQELVIIGDFVPAPMSDAELRVVVEKVMAETGADYGKTMKQVMQQLGGKADGKRVAELVRELGR